ncbi:hypothetical protein [Streptodolium elevatio]
MSGRREPRWAWWVIGIVIPVIGIAVTLWAATLPASDPGGSAKADTAGGTGTPRAPAQARPEAPDSGATAQMSPSAETPRELVVRSADIMLEPGLNYVDLDALPPTAAPSADGADLMALFDRGDRGLVTEGSATALARLPTGGPPPTPAQCAAALKAHGGHQAGAPTVGARFCAATGEGHLAYLEIVLGVPVEPHIRLKATVWE